MKLKEKFLGTLLAVCIVLGGLIVNGNVAYAEEDLSNYCEQGYIDRLFEVSVEAGAMKMNFFDAERIGYINPDGTRGTVNGRDDVSKVEYWISGGEFANFMQTWGDFDSQMRTWNEAGLFEPENRIIVDNVAYFKLVTSDEVIPVIERMNEALFPVRMAMNSGSGDSESCDSGSSDESNSHEHNFVETTVQEATATSDEIIVRKCSICGLEENGGSQFTKPGTAVTQFLGNTIDQLKKAPENGSITIDTEIWTCFNRPVIEALKNRQDVTTTINFRYKGVTYTFTIPAGYGSEQLDGLLDENGYCGFMYLVSVFGGQEIVK